MKQKHPEPMSMIHKRQKALDQGEFDPIREVPIGRAVAAAEAAAAWDLNDPFAYGRTLLHAKKGIIDPLETLKEMRDRTIARQAAKRKEVDDAKV